MSLMYEAPERYTELEDRRTAGPVFWSEAERAWMVFGFAECDVVMRDGDTFASHNQKEAHTPERWEELTSVLGGERALVLLPEPEHSQLVTLIRRKMTSNMPGYLDTRVRPVVDAVIKPFLDAGGGEFCADFSNIVPPAVIASVLGLPWEDRELLLQWKRWDEATVELVSSFDNHATDEGRQVSKDIFEYMLPFVAARREQPEDDFISVLWDIVPQVLGDCTEEDIVAQCRQLFLGGSHSTTYALNNAGVLLFTDPALWQRLKADPSEVDLFVEEVLRVMGVVQQRPRTVTKDVELGGQQLKAGDHVYLSLPAANRDPNQYRCPFAVSLEPADRKRHLAFGAGPKTCAGMALARAEAKEILIRLLESIDNPRLDPDKPGPVFDADAMTAAWRPLHVVFDDIRGS